MDQISHEMDALCLPKMLRVRLHSYHQSNVQSVDIEVVYTCFVTQARVNAYYDYLWLNVSGLSHCCATCS